MHVLNLFCLNTALKAINEAGVLHRDISYGNILLTPKAKAREGNSAFITDFDLVLEINPDTGEAIGEDSTAHHHATVS